MTIQIDTREKPKAIKRIIDEFDRQGVVHFSSKLFVGDYLSFDNPLLVIDRKQNLSEVYNNLCHEHKRFTDELKRANEVGIRVIVLVEHGGNIKGIEDVNEWNNPRLEKTPYAWNGERLCRVMKTIQAQYGVDFMFCDKRSTGKTIIKILSGKGQI